MKRRRNFVFLLVMSALALQTCSNQAAIATGIAQTQQISQLQTAAAAAGHPSTGGAVAATSSGDLPYVTVSTNTNCRSGPSQSYTLLTTINVGQQAEVLKIFSNDYVVIRNPNGSGDCWLFLQYANTTDFSAFNLPFATQPPTSTPTSTPTPEISWEGNWVFYVFDQINNVHIDQSGNSISGSGEGDFASSQPWTNVSFKKGSIYILSFRGSLSENRRVATGSWEITFDNGVPYADGNFSWRMAGNMNQFAGFAQVNEDGRIGGPGSQAWCGSRGGAPKPDPCLEP